MTKKQKKMLIRIIVSALLIVALKVVGSFVEINRYLEFALYMIPYFVIFCNIFLLFIFINISF